MVAPKRFATGLLEATAPAAHVSAVHGYLVFRYARNEIGKSTSDPRPWVIFGRVLRDSIAIIMTTFLHLRPPNQPKWLFRARVAAALVTMLVDGIFSASARSAVDW